MYLVDVDRVVDYDWGSAILAHIYIGLNSVRRGESKSLECFWQLIEVIVSFCAHIFLFIITM